MRTKKSQKRVRKTQKHKKCIKRDGGNTRLVLRDAQTKITELNEHLQRKCPNLRLQLDFVKNLTGEIIRYSSVEGPTTRARGARLILCLYKTSPVAKSPLKLVVEGILPSDKGNSKCISSIEMNVFFDKEIIINSKTDSKEEGKKYNKMLRAVVMIVGGFIPGIKQLHSVAENPISAWLLIDNFKVEYATIGNGEFFDYLKKENIDINHLSRDKIFAFYADKTQHNLISLYVPFNTSNTTSAMKLFMDLVNPSSDNTIVCS